MENPPLSADHDPAFPFMTMDILGNVLSRAEHPADVGQYLTAEIRELTGARCALFLQYPVGPGGTAHRVLAVNPTRLAEWVDSAPMHRFYEIVHEHPAPRLWRPADTCQAAEILQEQDCALSLTIPLRVGDVRVGSMLVLGLPDEAHLASVMNLLNTLSTVVALVFRNAFLYEKQEQIIQDRTQQLQKTNDSLREIGQFNYQVIQNAKDGIIVYDREMRYRLWNPFMEQISGTPAADVLGLKPLDVFPFLSQTLVLQNVERALRGQISQPLEFHYDVPHKGLSGWVSDTTTPLRNTCGDIIGAISIVREITAEKQAKEALQLQRERLEMATRAGNVGIWDYDLVNDRLFWDASMYRLYAANPAQRMSNYQTWRNSIHPDDKQRMDDEHQLALRGQKEYDTEFRIIWPDGSIRHIHAKATIQRDHAGKPLRMIGTNWDITPRKLAEDALHATNLELLAINHTIAACTASLDMQTVLNRVLNESLAITGLEGGTICLVDPDHTLRIVAHRAASDATVADLTQHRIRIGDCLCGNCALDCRPLILRDRCAVIAYATREATRNEDIRFHAAFPLVIQEKCLGVLCVFTRTDHKPDERSLTLLETVTGQIAMAIQNSKLFRELTQELTERQRAEQAERAARAQAEAANRAKDQFIAVLSHELRTPLTPVLAEVELLQRSTELSPQLQSSLDMIHRNVKLEAQLISDLLDITKTVRGELRLDCQPCDAHICLRETIEICQPQISAKHHQIILNLHAPQHHLFADPVRLRQIFWNLLGNAVKYTPDGGRIELRSSNDHPDRFQLQVIDNGVGVMPEIMDKLFKPFVQGEQTLSRRFGGLGLGLSIAKALVEAHHGTLAVTSPGRNLGATFTAQFPTLLEPPSPPKPLTPPAAISTGPLHILLVEDNLDTLRVMKQLLRLSRHHVQTATTVREALELATTTTFDLLLSDIGLPDGTGWELLEKLMPHHPIKALALSGFVSEDDIQKSKKAGFLDHLAKPISPELLERTIAQVMARR